MTTKRMPPVKSLRTQLLLWLLGPLLLFVGINIWLTYDNATDMATVLHDRILLGSARIIAEQIHYDDGAIQAVIPPGALELFQSGAHDRVYYRLATADNTILLGDAELPPPPHPLHAEEIVYFDTVFRGDPVRIVAFGQPLFSAPKEAIVVVEVAQTRLSSKILANQIWFHAARQQILIIGLSIILLWIGLRRGLRPILQLRDRMLRRKPGALDPLDVAAVPHELASLVHAINDYVQRLDDHMSAHSVFIANASHQLRTPLTLLNTQVNFGLRNADIAAKDEALHAMYISVQQAIRLVNQLLVFSTAEAGIGHPHRQSRVDLAAIVQTVLEELALSAQTKNIDLGVELAACPHIVSAAPTLLHELVANLIDNALRYTPPNGIVTASVSTLDDCVVLQIEDNGPGIADGEREKVFERFYRLQHDKSDGCGLGLPIVREIATASAATVTLSNPATAHGLLVTVIFPAADDNPAEPSAADT